jgi:hypothetical protein
MADHPRFLLQAAIHAQGEKPEVNWAGARRVATRPDIL